MNMDVFFLVWGVSLLQVLIMTKSVNTSIATTSNVGAVILSSIIMIYVDDGRCPIPVGMVSAYGRIEWSMVIFSALATVLTWRAVVSQKIDKWIEE